VQHKINIVDFIIRWMYDGDLLADHHADEYKLSRGNLYNNEEVAKST